MKKAAIVYDFDKTLCAKDMQEYSLIPDLGYQNPASFWKEVSELSRAQRMDSISAYLYLLKKRFEEQGKPLSRESFRNLGKQIQLYSGVETWFERINRYGESQGIAVEHYIISSGMQEIIESVPIAEQMKKIYACRYYYDAEGFARWPAQIINYTTKTQYIFRINKQVLDEDNEEDLNTWIPFADRAIPFTRMIYIADGMTDVPCMRLVKEYSGKSIAVYNAESAKAGIQAERLMREGRVNFMAAADYREGSDMEALVCMILDHMGADARLEELEGKVK